MSFEAMMRGAADVISRTGAHDLDIGCHEEVPCPNLWYAVASYSMDEEGKTGNGEINYWIAGVGFDPLGALFDLCDKAVDGGTCLHCGRPTCFATDFEAKPLEDVVCWWQWDPELEVFRQSCS